LPAAGFLAEPVRLLGPDLATPILQEAIQNYISKRTLNTRKYEEHSAAVRAGAENVGEHGPIYPAAEEELMLQAGSILAEWKVSAAIEPLYEALNAAQGAVYIPLVNRKISGSSRRRWRVEVTDVT
jgi:hypothetical protein